MECNLISQISTLLCIPEKAVKEYAGFSSGKRDYYAVLKIPKKRKPNEFRIVYSPTAEIKTIQHFLVDHYFSKLPIHPSATAYVKGTNVILNATSHKNNAHFLLTDIKNFFDSIDPELIKELLLKNNIFSSELDIDAAIKLCTHNNCFVQGCVSSPLLANAYLYNFDIEMEQLSKTLPNGKYTRYSDDMCFSSSERIPIEILDVISEALNRYHLKLNQQKTHFISNIERLAITGIRIKNNKSIGLNTAFKKILKREIYQFQKKVDNNIATIADKNHLMGLLAYLKMADPQYYNVLIIKYRGKYPSFLSFVSSLKRNQEGFLIKQ